MKIVDPTTKEELSTVKVLVKYFGRKEGQSLGEFSVEVKRLTESDKNELARLAATQLGLLVTD